MGKMSKRVLNRLLSCILVLSLIMASVFVPVNAGELPEEETEGFENEEKPEEKPEEVNTNEGEIEITLEEESEYVTPEDVEEKPDDRDSQEEEIIEEEIIEDTISEDNEQVEEEIEDPAAYEDEYADEYIVEDIDEDPLAKRYRRKVVDQASLIPIADVATDEWGGDFEYDHGRYSEGINISKGIDVSKYQKDIDWEKVKEDGVEFAFIRVGFRGYGSTGSLNEDILYKENIEGALKASIPVGVYMFSQATSVYEAVEEADYILERIRDYNITLPVIMDYEFAGDYGRLERAQLSREEATAVCNAFCERVSEEGYEAMVYADYGMLRDHLYPSEIEDNYKIWIARWNDTTEYDSDYNAWQFSDIGRVEGISDSSGYIPTDLNFGYGLLDISVTLNAMGGSFGDDSEITTVMEQGMTLLDAKVTIPKMEGMTFRGWSDDIELNKANFDFSAPVLSRKLELYAVWRRKKVKSKQAVSEIEPTPDKPLGGGQAGIAIDDVSSEFTDYIMPEKCSLNGHLFVRFLDADSISIDNIAEYKCLDGKVTPTVMIYYEPFGCTRLAQEPSENAILLTEGRDYKIRLENNRRPGSYDLTNRWGLSKAPTITVIGRNDYKGSEEIHYSIYK